MKLAEQLLPPGYRFRELWLPELINGNATLPGSVGGGHGLTLTGARKGTSADGVHGDGTSEIVCGIIHNNAVKFWVSLRFKLDQPFVAGDAVQYLVAKNFDATHRVLLYLGTAAGRLRFVCDDGANIFNVASTETSWAAGVWYHVLASFSDANGVRLIVNNGAPVTNATLLGVNPNGGNLVLINHSPGAVSGHIGTISDVFIGTDDLSQAAPDEEEELYKGRPPLDVVNEYPLDEGRGVTAYDRGSGGNNGTLDTTATWKFGRVVQPLLSLDGIDDHAAGAGVDISGDLSFIWAGKMKSTYDGLSDYYYFARIFIAANDQIQLYYVNTTDAIRWEPKGGGTVKVVDHTVKPAIDDYWIMIGTAKVSGEVEFFVNGISVGTNTALPAISAAAATAYIGSSQTPNHWDVSKPLLVGLISGALSKPEAKALSRNINNHFGLGLSI